MRERRQHIRVRPLLELPAKVHDGDKKLQVVDASIGGMLLMPASPEHEVGATLHLTMQLGPGEPFAADAVIRHRSGPGGNAMGVEFVELSDTAKTQVRRYVAELLERGSQV
jgi:c-di-GMP-binding flagellar brake protein YcgR